MNYLLLFILIIVYTICIIKYYNEEIEKINKDKIVIKKRLCETNKNYENLVNKNREVSVENKAAYYYETHGFDTNCSDTPGFDTSALYPFSIEEDSNITDL